MPKINYKVGDMVWVEPDRDYTCYCGPAKIIIVKPSVAYQYTVKIPVAVYVRISPLPRTTIAVREDEIKYRC